MPVMVSGSSYEPAPQGLHQAVCCDVVDLGIVDGEFGKRHKVQLRWQIEALTEQGKRFVVRRSYGASLHQKADLRKDLESWRGRAFTKEELTGFDLERLIGVNCQVQILHNVTSETVYANVISVVPLGKGMEKIEIDSYVREKDRTDKKPAAHDEDGENQYGDDDVPF